MTIFELARLASFLREERAKVNRSCAVLASCTDVSEATLKRAATGRALPTWNTVVQYLHACHVGPEPVYVRMDGKTFFTDHYSGDFQGRLSLARFLWDKARGAVAEVEKPRPRPLPTCRFVYDEAGLSARLRELHDWAWSPSAHAMEERAGDYGVLPHSTAHRIVKGKTIPGHPLQLEGFLRACGLPESEWEGWTAAWWQVKGIRLVDTVRDKLHAILEMLAVQRGRESDLAAY
ncbi:helix-turn-helix transcriptional regulator [Streptomyces sp. NPDC091371]|uniref:helix-turn-helix domain-containing protein n=1 Tax=Streptomyces sp. NPDC091371 TaxID=3155303 RepID=UPI003427D243